jgi:LysM repeat protein
MPASRSQMEEEKEPHFLAGKSCINSMDYRGAIEQFEKALQINPRSASAHFQLAWLYEEKEPDPAAAIYHYEKYLRLRPNAANVEVIRERINNCKQDLAKTALPLPITPSMQHQLEQLADENKRLRDEVERWKAYYASQSQQPSPQHATPAQAAPAPARSEPAPQTSPAPIARQTRTHVVQSGESPYSIARRYGVKLDALMAANPGLDPRRMRVGQTLNIPAP